MTLACLEAQLTCLLNCLGFPLCIIYQSHEPRPFWKEEGLSTYHEESQVGEVLYDPTWVVCVQRKGLETGKLNRTTYVYAYQYISVSHNMQWS